MASRVCASMLHAANCTETIVNSYQEYENLAVELAQNKEKFEQLKERTIQQIKVSPLFDTQKYVKDFEKALQQIWKIYSEGRRSENVEIV
jgi:protein O-GlcNAc transferase